MPCNRRRTDVLRTITTLNELCKELEKLGFIISRSATYLRLKAKNKNSNEAKRHVKCLPIRLLRPENNLRKENEDRIFAKSLVDDVHDIYSLFGPDCITFLSNDDKARIALGLPAAKLQTPILMHLEFKVNIFFYLKAVNKMFNNDNHSE